MQPPTLALAVLASIAVHLSQVQAIPISLAPADDIDDSVLLDGLDPFEDTFEPLLTETFGDVAEDVMDAQMEASASSSSTSTEPPETEVQRTEAFMESYFTSKSVDTQTLLTAVSTTTTSTASATATFLDVVLYGGLESDPTNTPSTTVATGMVSSSTVSEPFESDSMASTSASATLPVFDWEPSPTAPGAVDEPYMYKDVWGRI
ncbi:hypothetical protein AURDEDRAFT_156052 [Auricularia subglabra TFB-10046 SS5]|nr:hypothetical protein AURDEDRAFT_156052 [Auricularia subglabra TFB-10046 SS5]